MPSRGIKKWSHRNGSTVIYLDYNATTPLVNAIYQLSFLNKKEDDMIWKDLLKKIKVFKDLSSEEINLVEKLVKKSL